MHAIEKKLKAIPEGSTNKGMSSKKPSSSRSCPAFKNPRIVPVPRWSGHKDRHSKVSTIRGLRDRRIRLSVQTAIQLYELQDALGLGQPSKVIDWLLEASKDDIDKLPPLPIRHYGITHLHQELDTNASRDNSCIRARNSGIKMDTNSSYDHCNMMPTLKFWDIEASMRTKKALNLAALQGNHIGHENNYTGHEISAQNLFPISQYPYLPAALLNNVCMPNNNSYYHWEPPNLSLSQFSNHNENSNALALQPSLAFPSGNQLFFCPPPFVTNQPESSRRQIIDHLQFLSSLNVNPWLIHSEK